MTRIASMAIAPAALASYLFLLLCSSAAVAIAAEVEGGGEAQRAPWRIHTLFSVECQNYFDWQTVGLLHSFKKARQPGPITRLLSCTEEERRNYKGMDLAPTFEVPSMSRHPKSGDWYPAINKPVGVLHWIQHSKDAENVDWVVILDADMIMRGPIIPWELGAEKGKPVAALYGYEMFSFLQVIHMNKVVWSSYLCYYRIRILEKSWDQNVPSQ